MPMFVPVMSRVNGMIAAIRIRNGSERPMLMIQLNIGVQRRVLEQAAGSEIVHQRAQRDADHHDDRPSRCRP